jgi:hypothetical protein
MEETYTPMTMKPVSKIICDSQFLAFLYITYSVFSDRNMHLIKEMPEDKKIAWMLIGIV